MWCTDLPHLVHLLTLDSPLRHVFPPRASTLVLCFLAASESCWALACVLASMQRCREGLVAYAWCI